jgi:hypothetical protein
MGSLFSNEKGQYISQISFRTDADSEQYCRNIFATLISIYGLSQSETLRQVNKWKGPDFVGRLRLTVQGDAGQIITLRHAEVLENGELGTPPYAQRRPPITTLCVAMAPKPGNRASPHCA